MANHQSDYDYDYYSDDDSDPYAHQGYDGRRRDLASNPASALDRGRRDMGRLQDDSRQAIRGAMEHMARYQSDQLALLMALPMGIRSNTFEHRNTDVEVVEKLKVENGVVVGKEITTTTKSSLTQRYHRFD